MKIYFSNQEGKLDSHLKDLIHSKVSEFDKSKLKEQVSLIDIQTSKALEKIDIHFLFTYKIFPPSIMSFKTQWEYEDREMRIGDTIVQQVFIPPLKSFSQKIIFGVRINNIITEPRRKGFSYEALEGHVEKGESTFSIEPTDKAVIFKIQTFSEPGHLISRLVSPIFSVPYQAYCTRKALENVKNQIESQQ